jgi:hypothetical protein
MQEDPLDRARNFTVEERRRNFLAWKQRHANCEEQQESTIWHLVDDPPTQEQYDKIPPGRPGMDGRSKPMWIKYRHDQRREVVVAKGYFDHEDGRWRAQYHPIDEGDLVRAVEAIAWTHITPGVRPWDGPVV